jgi:hypothetical protein
MNSNPDLYYNFATVSVPDNSVGLEYAKYIIYFLFYSSNVVIFNKILATLPTVAW